MDGRAGQGFHHAVDGGCLAGKTARQQADIALRFTLDIQSVNSTEKFRQRPAEYENGDHNDHGPDRLPAQIRRVTFRGDFGDQKLSPDRPDRKCQRAGQRSAQQLNGRSRDLREPSVIEHRRRPERGSGNDSARGDGVRAQSQWRQRSPDAVQGLRIAGRAKRRSGRVAVAPEKSENVACQRAGRTQTAAYPAEDDDRQQRKVNPSSGYFHPELDGLKACKFHQQHERCRHDRNAGDCKHRRVAGDQRRQIQPTRLCRG